MSVEPAIRISGVSKCYPMYEKPHHRLKQMVFGRFGHSYARPFWALHDVSLEVAKGEAVGIVGRNGSGKSTLLQIISGILQPTEGTVEVNGRVAALLELGAGFNPDFTGRENVYMNGSILGLTHDEMDQRIDAIESFAGIGDFIDQPVKSYSSGMMVRLAFSVQVQIEPDVLIVDEALAVGDALFQKRCYQRMEQLIQRGTTLLFVSHDQESVRTLTSRALLLNKGRTSCLGSSAEVLLAYRKQLHEAEQEQLAAATEEWGKEAPAKEEGQRSGNLEFGDREVEVLEAQVLDEHGEPTQVLYPGDRFVFAITCRVHHEATHLNVAFRLRNKQGIKITSWGTLNEQIRKQALNEPVDGLWDRTFNPGEVFTVQFEGTCALGPNFYEIQATVTEEPSLDYVNQRILHWQDEAALFTVHPRTDEYVFGGICDLGLTSRVEVQKPDAAAT